MQKIRIIIDSKQQKLGELIRTCRMISEQTLKKPGCLKSIVLQDKNNENRILFKQHWDQLDQLDDFFRSNRFSALLGAMGFLGETYEIFINNGTSKDGKLAVEKARAP